MLRYLLILFCLAGPAAATQDRWPALFDVTGVASNDQLNVRAAPTSDADIVGTLPYDGRDIEIIQTNDRETWGMVNIGEGAGWVSLRFMQRHPGQWLGAPIDAARCGGTEPFWSLDFSGDQASWSYFDDQSDGSLIRPQERGYSLDTTGVIYRLDDGREGTAFLALGSCNDGMSDREFGIRLRVIHDLGQTGTPELFNGCCSLQMHFN